MKLYSWGSNSNGQVGQGFKTESVDIPSVVPIPPEVTQTIETGSFFGGGNHSFILTGNGRVYGAGLNTSRQLCLPDHTEVLFTSIDKLSTQTISSIACGWDFSIFLSCEGALYGSGSNKFGQLLHSSEPKQNSSEFVAIKSNHKIIQISAGMRHVAAVTVQGTLETWGYDRYINSNQSKDIVKVVCGQHHISTLDKVGNIMSWGANRYGQCAQNPDVYKVLSEPSSVTMPEQCGRVVDIVSGWTHTMALTECGEVYTWGRNTYGQLGRSKEQSDFQPLKIPFSGNIKCIVAGSEHSMALDENGELWTWGWNEHGSCGNGTQTDQFFPQNITHHFQGRIHSIGSGAGHCFALVQC